MELYNHTVVPNIDMGLQFDLHVKDLAAIFVSVAALTLAAVAHRYDAWKRVSSDP